MGRKYRKGDHLTFHGTLGGKRQAEIKGVAEEPGETGIAQKWRVRMENGKVVRVPGKNIYIILPYDHKG